MQELSLQFFQYQYEGATWLAGKTHALLSDDMGLGKSAQAILACDNIGAKTILVVCPASVTENWAREFKKFSRRRPNEYTLEIVSYDIATRNRSKLMQSTRDVLILDESHYLKAPESQRSKAIFGVNGICRISRRTWCLSGTPAPNHGAELWILLYSFGRTLLPYDLFVAKYCVTTQVHPRRVQIHGTKTEMIPEIRSMLKPIMLRRSKAEVALQLPPISFGDLFVEPSEVTISPETKLRLQADHERVMAKLAPLERDLLGGVPENDQALLLLLEGLAESVSTLRRYTGMQKAQTAAMLVAQELADGAYDKIVIFAVHRDVIDAVKIHFPDAAVVTGDTPTNKRQAEIDRFQKSKKCTVFIGNILAAGVGITLTAAHHVLFVEQDWVPGNNAQAAMRCHRIGQLMPVSVRFVSLVGSIDERIAQVLKRKTKEIAQMLNPDFF